MIQVNKNPSGRHNNMIFGLFAVADGLVRIFSLGFLHSTFTLDYARRTAKNRLIKLKKECK